MRLSTGCGSVCGVETALALVTLDGGGLDVLPVVEVDGVLVVRGSGVPVDLVALVALVRVPELVAA